MKRFPEFFIESSFIILTFQKKGIYYAFRLVKASITGEL